MGNQQSDGSDDEQDRIQPLNTRDLPVNRVVASRGQSSPSNYRAGGAQDPHDGDVRQEAARANAAGVEYLRRSMLKEAVRQFEVALQYEPGSVQILNNIGLAYAKMQDFDAAFTWYDKAHRQDLDDVETVFSLAWVERKRQRYVHARELFVQVLQAQPDHVKALYLLGDILKSQQDYEGAIEYFKRLVQLDPDNADGKECLRSCYESMLQSKNGGFESRQPAAAKARKPPSSGDMPSSLAAQRLLALSVEPTATIREETPRDRKVESPQPRPKAAAAAVQEVAPSLRPLEPASSHTDYKARSPPLDAQQQRVKPVVPESAPSLRPVEPALSEVDYKALPRTTPGEVPQVQRRGVAAPTQHQQKLPQQPVTSSREGALDSYSDSKAGMPLGQSRGVKASGAATKEASEADEQAARDDTRNVQALLKAALQLRMDTSSERNLEAAREKYEEVLKVNPNNVEALDGAAYCHRKMNNLDTAIQLYQSCLKVSPNAEGPLYYLGDILYRRHRHAECQHYLSRLVELSSSLDYKTGALYQLAKSHVSLEEYGQAETHARNGLGFRPNHPHFLFILALVKNRIADYDTSITLLNQALEHCDTMDDARGQGAEQLKHEIHDWLAQAYERKQDYKSAMAQVDLALQGDPSHVSALITKGQVHIQLRQLDQAETAFRRALAVEKNHAMAMLRLGYCKLLSNAHQDATQFFQRTLQQRCGTVALPASVKGCARVYLALTLMGQQDVDGALNQLLEARRSHKNFKEVCNDAKETIVKGECEGLVNRLRTIPDLDINTAQAWQLVHLMARQLEMDLQNKGSGEGSGGQESKAVSGTRGSQPRQGFMPGSGAAGVLNGVAPGPLASKEPAPTTAMNGEHQARRWSAPTEAENKRSWVTPSTKEQAAPTGVLGKTRNQGEKFQQPLKLESHELIDVGEITQGECLGTGGFGAVYRGTWRGREVAVKKLFCEDGGYISPLQLEELEKEVAALKSLNHPRLVAFIGACLTPPNLCILTEFMPGGSLHHLLHKAKTSLALSQQGQMALQVAEGVAFLHSLTPPVVHRDLKSLNIILDKEYNAKICDFGLTQSMEKTHISLKDGVGGCGSPRYMAPECYDSKGKITEKVDVWAEGCILIEIFGGPLPYDECQNIQQIMAKVLIEKELPYIPHTLLEGARPIIEACFHFDITKRAAAQDVYRRLRELRF